MAVMRSFILYISIILLCAAVSNPAAAATIKILAFGDSLTAGYGLPIEQSLPSRLEARLRAEGYDVTVINAGVSGDTTSGGLTRLPWTLKQEPDAVILALGANDMLRGVDPAVTRENLHKMLTMLKTENKPVLLAGMRAFSNFGLGYTARYDKMYEDLADEFDAVYYPFLLKGVALEPKLNQEDGLHPTAAGVDVIVDNILSKVEKLLKRVKTK